MNPGLGVALSIAATVAITLPAAAQLPVGSQAPDFTLRSTTGGQVSLSQYRGKQYVLLEFWSSSSTSSLQVLPRLRSLQSKYARQMVVLGVDASEQADTQKAQAAQGAAAAGPYHLNFPVLLNGDPVQNQYQASDLPVTYLIDPSGRIVEAQVGVNPDLWPKVEARVGPFQPPIEAGRDGIGGPKKASQILHALTFPMPPGAHEWIVGQDVTIRFKRPAEIPADLVSFSVDGKQVAIFGPDSTYTWDATAVSDGLHKLRVSAQTAAGSETWAVDQIVIVDNRPPIETAPAHPGR